jgi:O-antigen/teichoic acid export membrane protein
LSYFLFQFYGPGYPFSFGLASLMGVCVTLHLGVAVMMDLSAAEGVRGVRQNLFAAVLTALINVGANLIFIPQWGVAGTMAATILAFSCGLVYRYLALVRLQDVADLDA